MDSGPERTRADDPEDASPADAPAPPDTTPERATVGVPGSAGVHVDQENRTGAGVRPAHRPGAGGVGGAPVVGPRADLSGTDAPERKEVHREGANDPTGARGADEDIRVDGHGRGDAQAHHRPLSSSAHDIGNGRDEDEGDDATTRRRR